MQTNQEWIDEDIDDDVEVDEAAEGDAPQPSIMEKLSEWLEQVFESGADLEAEVEKAIFIELFSLLQEAGRDEPRRHKAIAKMLKFAKRMEQKRTRQDRTAFQNRCLDILQTEQEIKLRQMEMTSHPPAKAQGYNAQEPKAKEPEPRQPQISKQTPNKAEGNNREPVPPESAPSGIAQEPRKLEQPLPSRPEQPRRETSREIDRPAAEKITPERWKAPPVRPTT